MICRAALYAGASTPCRPPSDGEALALVVASFTVNYTGVAQLGDWLEAHTTPTRMGARLAFASCATGGARHDPLPLSVHTIYRSLH